MRRKQIHICKEEKMKALTQKAFGKALLAILLALALVLPLALTVRPFSAMAEEGAGDAQQHTLTIDLNGGAIFHAGPIVRSTKNEDGTETHEMISLGLVPVDIRYDERSRYYAALAAYEDKLRYSTRPESKTEKLAKLLAECELRSSDLWIKTFSDYCQADASGTEKADQAGQASASSPGGKGKGKTSRGK